MDEFFMVRVASLQDAINSNEITLDIAGLTQYQQLEKIKSSVKDIITMQFATYNRSLHSELAKFGIELIDRYENLNETQKILVDDYFDKNVAPVVTPIAVDMSSPFPLIVNKTLNISMLLKRKNTDSNKFFNYGEYLFGNVEVPSVLKR
jgi:polyphosphate kinase